MQVHHQVRARYDDQTIRVYQAFPHRIGDHAAKHGRFGEEFSLSRMTWIKPSFNWMMYRSGYGEKRDQEVVLALDITREGFEWALRHAALSSFDPAIHADQADWQRQLENSSVRIQWDPSRDWRLARHATERTIQMGLAGDAVRHYVEKWIVRIEDVSDLARAFAQHARLGTVPDRRPDELELPYPLPGDLVDETLTLPT